MARRPFEGTGRAKGAADLPHPRAGGRDFRAVAARVECRRGALSRGSDAAPARPECGLLFRGGRRAHPDLFGDRQRRAATFSSPIISCFSICPTIRSCSSSASAASTASARRRRSRFTCRICRGTASEVQARWYHEGLNAFEKNPHGADEIVRALGQGAVGAAAKVLRGETGEADRQVARAQRQGREEAGARARSAARVEFLQGRRGGGFDAANPQSRCGREIRGILHSAARSFWRADRGPRDAQLHPAAGAFDHRRFSRPCRRRG